MMIKTLAAAVALATPASTDPVEMNESPFLGGQGHNAILRQSAAIGGAGEVLIEGNDSIDEPAADDEGWSTITTLTAASLLANEIELSRWMRVTVNVAGTGTPTFLLEGVQ